MDFIAPEPTKWFPSDGLKTPANRQSTENCLHVIVYREPFDECCVIACDDGSTEELTYEEARNWLVERGADSYRVERKVLDIVWNEPRAMDVYINNPKSSKVSKAQSRIAPQL